MATAKGDSAGQPQEEASKTHILIVDDNEDNRNILSRQLVQYGYSISMAENGLRALEIVASGSFDLIILDIMMPEMNGFEFLERLKAEQILFRVPVIVISMLDDLDSVARCIEMGAEDYLPRPFNKTLLRARVSASLEKKKLRDREIQFYHAIQKSEKYLAKELADAAAYVTSLLPAPVTNGVHTEWQFIPSAQLGGDSFGYHWLDSDHFAIYLLDVAGHGIGSALLSITVMSLVRSQALPDTDWREPTQVLYALNKMFPRKKYNKHFSMWYGVYDKAARKLRYASGGHPPAILLTGPDPGRLRIERLQTRGLLVGLAPEVEFPGDTCALEPTSSLYVYSDGVYEITKTDGEMMDLEEFLEIVTMPSQAGISDIDRILNRVRELNAGDSFDDDVSLLKVTFQQ